MRSLTSDEKEQHHKSSIKIIRKKEKVPVVNDEERLSDDEIEGIDETIPCYKGIDESGNFWIGRKSSYLNAKVSDDEDDNEEGYENVSEYSFLNEDGQNVEVVYYDETYQTIIAQDKTIFDSIKFKNALKEGILKFTFVKVNGDKREAYGTTNFPILHQNGVSTVFKGNRKLGPNIRYYDMDKMGWRSFRPDSLFRIYEPVDMSEYR